MQWFLPIICFVASLIQFFVIVFKKNFNPKKAEIIYGLLGGTFNGFSIYCLLLAAIFADGIEKILLFPISAVSVIILCAVWGQVIYKEKVKWAAYGLCFIGILLPQIIEIMK
jgi:CDP-diglyceride synthetase